MSILFMIVPLILMLITFVLYVWQAVWVAIDSRKRGEEYWWLWTIAAFIAFPIAIIVYALVSRSDRRRCNNCGKEVPQNLNLCPFCGQKCGYLCPSCGQNVKPGWKFCPNCTTALPEHISDNRYKKGSNKPIIIIVSIIAIIVLLFVIIVSVAFTSFKVVRGSYEQEISVNEIAQKPYLGGEYEEEFTGTRSYGFPNGVSNVYYVGERKSGKVIIRLYDESGNLVDESEPIKNKKIQGNFSSQNGYGSKIELEFTNFEGSFYIEP